MKTKWNRVVSISNPLSWGQRQIRTRLLILLILFAVLPLALVSIIVVSLTTQNTRQQAEDTLNAVATLKENQINTWVLDLQRGLSAEYDRDADTRRILTLLRIDPGSLSQPNTIYNTLRSAQQDAFRQAVASRGAFEEIFLLNSDGLVVLSSNPSQNGQNYTNAAFFVNGQAGPAIQPPAYEPSLGRTTLLVSQPVLSEEGLPLGVLAGRANMNRLNEIMLERSGLGESGETYLIGSDLRLLTRSRDPNIASASTSIAGTPINTLAANLAVKAQQRGVAMYANYRSVDSIGAYRWLPDLQIGLLAEQSQAEAFAANQAVSNFALLAAAVAMLLAAIAAVVVSASLTRPITTLTSLASDTASTMDRASLAGYSQADQGQLNISPLDHASAALQSQLARRDEFGALAAAFDRMTIVLRRLLLGLEARVEQRTAEIQSRSDQILAAAEIGRTAASILETNALMQRVIELIQERFKLYYVGLFLVDENRQVAELAAATGRAGAAMLARRHRLLLGSGAAQSMVAWCIANDQPRIALEAEQDAVRLAAPELPETRSEVAIPLRARQEVIGALSIQSHLHNAFDSDTIVIFQAVASQLAIAIENARLFAASQQALVSLQQAYGEINRRAWLERLSARPIVLHRDASGLSHRDAYILDASIQDVSIQGEHAQGEHAQEVSPHTPAVALPIQARGQTIGYLHARPLSNQPGAWSEEKQELLTTLTEQLSVAIDSARLFEATQQQAARERMVAEISSRMRATLDIDTILQTIAAELCSALELAEVEIRLAGPESMPGETSLMDQAEANRLPHNSDGGAQ